MARGTGEGGGMARGAARVAGWRGAAARVAGWRGWWTRRLGSAAAGSGLSGAAPHAEETEGALLLEVEGARGGGGDAADTPA